MGASVSDKYITLRKAAENIFDSENGRGVREEGRWTDKDGCRDEGREVREVMAGASVPKNNTLRVRVSE